MKTEALPLPLALLLALLALVPAATPQRATAEGSAPPLANDDVSGLVTGEFSGNSHLDAVVLAGGRPVLRESVETYETYVSADVLARDLARLTGTGTGGRDQLVTVGADGLTLLELVSTQGRYHWDSTELRGPASEWAQATVVRTGQLDGQNGDDVVAATSGRILVALSDGQGGWQTDVAFHGPLGITGLELVDWDGTSTELELAVLSAASGAGPANVLVFRADGTLLASPLAGGDRMIASALATTTQGRRWLAVVTTSLTTGVQDLALVSSAGIAGPWSLGSAAVHASVAADWDGDGLDDLVLGTSASVDALLFRTEPAGADQLTLHVEDAPPEAPIHLPVGSPDRNPLVQDGAMAVGDVDYDGDLDLVTAVQGEFTGNTGRNVDPRYSAVEVTRNNHVAHEQWAPWHMPGTSWPEGLPLPSLDLASGALEVPLLEPALVLEGARLEYAVWRTPSAWSLAVSTPLVGPASVPIGIESGSGLRWSTLTIPIRQHEAGFPDRYTLIARQVVRDAAGALVMEGPALSVTFSSDRRTSAGLQWSIPAPEEVPPSSDYSDEPGGHSSGPGLPPTLPNLTP